jgi:rhodanese-related sulfurtransferase
MLKDLIAGLSIFLSSFMIGTSLSQYIPSYQISPEYPESPNTQLDPNGQPETIGKIPEATLEEVMEASEQKSKNLVDARPTAFFEFGRIPSAINIPFSRSEDPAYTSQIDPAKAIIVYCSNPTCPDSLKVATILSKNFPNIKTFTGGWEAWTERNLPTEP